jgi:hypothetical protein
MSKRFWVWVRIIGWLILLLWYITYAINALFPFLQYPLLQFSHGIIGIIATLMIFVGYYDLERNLRKKASSNQAS